MEEKKEVAKKNKKRKQQTRIRGKLRWMIILGALVAILLVFVFGFRLTNVMVTGNKRYSDKEIKSLCLNEEGYNNTLLILLMKRNIDTSNIPLLESVEVSYVDNHTILLKADEKVTVGMFESGENLCCIDQDGYVIEVVDKNAGAELGLPVLVGVTGAPVVGQKIEIEETVLNTLRALKSTFDKYAIVPDSIEINQGEEGLYTYNLNFSAVKVELGSDILLEEKMRRVAAILPQLEGMSGTLMLSAYSEDTVNIIFKQY